MTDITEELGLRERKKLKTRNAILEAAQRLIDQEGYRATTLEQICREVDVRTPTLLRYFSTKVELALAPAIDKLEEFRATIEDPNRSDDAIAIWRDHVERRSMDHATDLGRHQPWIEKELELRTLSDNLATQYEDVLAAGIAEDLGTDAGDFSAAILAAALVHGAAALSRQWKPRGGGAKLARYQMELIDRVLDGLAPQADR